MHVESFIPSHRPPLVTVTSIRIYQLSLSLSLCSLSDAVSVFLSPPGVLAAANVATTADTNPQRAVKKNNKINPETEILKICFIAVTTQKTH